MGEFLRRLFLGRKMTPLRVPPFTDSVTHKEVRFYRGRDGHQYMNDHDRERGRAHCPGCPVENADRTMPEDTEVVGG